MAKQKVIVRKSNSEVEGRFVDQSQINHERALRKLEMKKYLKSRTDILAKDFQYTKSFPVIDLKILWPEKPWLWNVDKYYPYADGGALFIDEPGSFHEFEAMLPKREFLKGRGIRYVLLTPNGTPFEDEQELMQCGQPQLKQSLI